MNPHRLPVKSSLGLIALGGVLGFLVGSTIDRGLAQEGKTKKPAKTTAEAAGPKNSQTNEASSGSYEARDISKPHLLQSPAAKSNRAPSDFGLGDNHAAKLRPYPPGGPGVRTPLDLWRYAGRGATSYGSPDLPMPWDEWVKMCQEQKPKLMADVQLYMQSRYSFLARRSLASQCQAESLSCWARSRGFPRARHLSRNSRT